MPGKKDSAFVKEHRERESSQSKSVLCKLNEAHSFLKQWYPNVKAGFSKFCEIRPRNTATAEVFGTHSICVYSTYQNVKNEC